MFGVQPRAPAPSYGQSVFFCPQFRTALWCTFLCTQVVVRKTESTGKRPVSRRRSLWKHFFIFFVVRVLYANNLKYLFAFSWGGFFSEHNSETGFEQLLEFPRDVFFPILF